MKRLVISTALLTLATTAGAVIYQITDDKGNVTLTNMTTDQPTGAVKIISTQSIRPVTRQYVGYDSGKPVATQTVAGANVFVYEPPANAPSGVRYDLNRLENVSPQTLARLGTKWRTNAPIVVAHFGDSHVQPGWQIAPIRSALQGIRGDGGRGMIFPYSMAKTYSQEDYKSRVTGNWKTANSIQQPPKIGVGVSGFVGRTSDSSASMHFDFKDSVVLGDTYALLYYKADGDYRLTLDNGTTSQTLVATATQGKVAQLPFWLPNTGNKISVRLDKIAGNEFEMHGLNLVKNGGLVYHNLGVGGANFKALIQQKHFADTFASLGADLVVLDWGTNDILYTNQIPNDFEKTVRDTIARIRAVNPEVAIILQGTQEARYKGKNTTAAQGLSHLMRQIATDEGVMFYDWYAISGGSGSMERFFEAGYASKDRIHLNGRGYRLEGGLFSQALTQALAQNY